MFIKTSYKMDQRNYFRLFDCSSGLRYSLYWHEPEEIEGQPPVETIELTIDSANSAQGEYGAGIRYDGIEALDFWSQLDQVVNPLGVIEQKVYCRKISEWIRATTEMIHDSK